QFGQIDPSISQGAAVEIVESGTPASNAGLAPGDIITTFQGIAVTSPAQLEQLETGYHPGDTVNVGWVTPSGQNISARLQLMAGPWA
ncbi:MAG: PDZ domain-containing protein, partial [Clostridia bacterium]